MLLPNPKFHASQDTAFKSKKYKVNTSIIGIMKLGVGAKKKNHLHFTTKGKMKIGRFNYSVTRRKQD